MATIRLNLPAKLVPVFTAPNKRYRGAYGGRGSAKTRTFAKMAALKGFELSQAGERGLIVCGREYMNSLDESSMSEVKEAILSEPWLAEHYDIGEKYIRTKDKRIEFAFIGLRHNLDSIKSKARIRLFWVDEAEPVSEAAWEKAIPTVREHDSEIWVTWNPESRHSAANRRFRECADGDMIFVEMNWRDNPWFPEVLERERQRDKRDRPDDYDHVWEGGFRTSVTGAIYGKQILKAKEDKRFTKIPVESCVVVNTFWDLGRNDHNAIWFHQQVGHEHRFVDYYENRLQDLEHYARILKEKGYLYGTHFLPHDGEAKYLGMNRTRKQQLEDMGIRPVEIVPRIQNINDGIEMVRKVFGSCWFDEKRCERGIEALSHYQWKYNESTDTHMNTPLHNWASNGADAFRQFAQGYRSMGSVDVDIADLYQGAF